MNYHLNLHRGNLRAKNLPLQVKRMLVVVMLPIIISGCSGHLSMNNVKSGVKRFFKSDLNAFLDGDGDVVRNKEQSDPIAEPVDEGAENAVGDIIDANDSIQEVADNESLERCSPDDDPKFSYRRRVALLAFDITNRQESTDFPHIETEYPQLLQDFIDNERFAVTSATHYRLLGNTDARNGAWVESRRRQIMQLAKELGVQFIVTGAAEDMSVIDPEVNALQLFTNDAARKALTGAAKKKLTGKVDRHLALTLDIYDGGTGRLIKRQGFADSTAIKSRSLSKRKYLNKAYLKSQYGQMIGEMLKQQGESLLLALDCIPMQMKVLAVNDEGVTFDAGIESLVLPGDKLQLFRRVKFGWGGDSEERYQLERYGALTVSRTNTYSAEGVFDQANMASGVNPGDIVQAW